MTQASILPAEHPRYSHIIANPAGQNIGLIYPQTNESRGTTMYVELGSGGREVRNLEDAQTYIDMVLSGEWAKVSSGEMPSPFDY